MSSDIDAIYKNAKVVLWVEDPETKAWLDAVWSEASPTIQVLVGGGRVNVEGLCKHAHEDGADHVFGLVDQDFGTTNAHRWNSLTPQERIYRLDVHEFENLVIVPGALAGCRLNTGQRSIQEIDAHLIAAATQRLWWIACTRFLAETRQAATADYPPDPGLLVSLADAEAYVLGSGWFTTTAGQCNGLAAPTAVSQVCKTHIRTPLLRCRMTLGEPRFQVRNSSDLYAVTCNKTRRAVPHASIS